MQMDSVLYTIFRIWTLDASMVERCILIPYQFRLSCSVEPLVAGWIT